MADIVVTDKKQSLAEIRQWDVDFTYDLPTGVTVLSATATHIPPSGAPSNPVVGTIFSGAFVPVTLGPLSVLGIHILDVIATFSNTNTSEVKLHITVEF
jgi:hypothetical protein